MKNTVLTLIFFFTTFIQAQNKEVQQTIETFFEGFHQRDSIKIKSVCADAMILQSISEGKKGTKLENEKPSEFYKSIATIPSSMQFQEKILSFNIQVDGTMAHVWTPYEFYVNGKLSHLGVNAFTLFKEDNVWKIIHLIDTRRK
ncbi:nuclear transport factor 2 family protein [Flavobacterium sp.]|uniref:nuclear transport factor 2 family protein n=1 Tax=Flavobacterium sp. TaxID=239 RepID=UPI002B4B560A|nr:nuclear transport factor 2 family protein [Flavobacterium sp.]HLP64639.1 nuclear transport factor 2 family protein [Flavobacterium sp.]